MKISKIASMLLIGSMTAMLIGCGDDDSSSSSSSSTSGTASDAYIEGANVYVDMNDNGIGDKGDINTTTNANGKFTFNRSVGNHKIIVKSGTDIATGEIVAETLVLRPNGKYNVTPLTTMVSALMDKNITREAAEGNVSKVLGLDSTDAIDEDPVINKEAAKATLKLNVVKTLSDKDYSQIAPEIMNGNNLSTIADKNISKLIKSIDDTNITDTNIAIDLETAVIAIAKAAKNDNTILTNDINLTAITETIKDSNAKPKILVESIKKLAESNISVLNEGNATAINNVVKWMESVVQKAEDKNQSVDLEVVGDFIKENMNNILKDGNISNEIINNIINKATPITYTSKNIEIGDINVTFDENGYFGTVNVEVNGSSTYESFATIKIPSVKVPNPTDQNGTYEGNLTINITDNKDHSNSIEANLLNIEVIVKKDGNVSYNLVKDKSEVTITNNGLKGLSDIEDNATKSATISENLTNTDFEFDFDTIKNATDVSRNTISTTIDELNEYLRKDRTYNIKIEIDTKLPLEIKKFFGSVKVKNTDSETNDNSEDEGNDEENTSKKESSDQATKGSTPR